MRSQFFVCMICIGIAPCSSAWSQTPSPWQQTVPAYGVPTYRPNPAERLPPLIQLDATALLEPPPPPPAEPPPQQRPMFSNGWTRDGFGGQPRGWR